jgi:hypothetical protein
MYLFQSTIYLLKYFQIKISDKNKTPLKILSAGFHIPLSLRRGVRGEVL